MGLYEPVRITPFLTSSLIPQVLSYENHDMASLIAGVTQEVYVTAYTVCRIAVVACTVNAARSLQFKPLGIHG
jgi:hypothetical protein